MVQFVRQHSKLLVGFVFDHFLCVYFYIFLTDYILFHQIFNLFFKNKQNVIFNFLTDN